MSTRSTAMIAAAALALAAANAFGTVYCCTNADGRRVCGDIMPTECMSRAYREFGSQGTVVRQHDAPLTPEQRAAKDAELARKRAEERRLADEQRRDRALLASYASAKDIDVKRDRTVADAESHLQATQARYDNAVAKREELAKEMQFYANKPIPEGLKARMRDNEAEIANLLGAIAARKQDIADIVARYDEEKQRYLRLQDQRAAERPAR